MIPKLAICAASVAIVSGCTSTTTASAPGEFKTLHAGTYPPAQQLVMMDCVFDAFLGVQNVAMATHVRQVKRADGYRIDVIAESRQFMVADIKDDGNYRLSRTYSAVSLDKETIAAKACITRFGKLTEDNPYSPPAYNPYAATPR